MLTGDFEIRICYGGSIWVIKSSVGERSERRSLNTSTGAREGQ